MHVEMRPLSSIRPYENNPRLNDAAVDAVAASIQEFGFRQPIVVDEAGVIIVGHTRYKASLKLGLHEVPVHVAIGLSPAQAKAYRLADNQTAHSARDPGSGRRPAKEVSAAPARMRAEDGSMSCAR
jgi:site-specific DNA-methyltransferase (adenine-specific)